MTAAELVRAAEGASGLSSRRFAKVIGRDKRVVARWKAGSSPVPVTVVEWCRAWLRLPVRVRTIYVRAFERAIAVEQDALTPAELAAATASG